MLVDDDQNFLDVYRETLRKLPGEPAVLGIAPQEFRVVGGGLPVRAGRDDQPQQVFDVPAALTEVDGQPIASRWVERGGSGLVVGRQGRLEQGA